MMNRDSIDRAFERAEEQLERDLADGRISQADFNAEVRELARDHNAAMDDGAAEAAERWRGGY